MEKIILTTLEEFNKIILIKSGIYGELNRKGQPNKLAGQKYNWYEYDGKRIREDVPDIISLLDGDRKNIHQLTLIPNKYFGSNVYCFNSISKVQYEGRKKYRETMAKMEKLEKDFKNGKIDLVDYFKQLNEIS